MDNRKYSYLTITKDLIEFRKNHYLTHQQKYEIESLDLIKTKKIKFQDLSQPHLISIESSFRVKDSPSSIQQQALTDRSSRASSLSLTKDEKYSSLSAKCILKMVRPGSVIKILQPEKTDKNQKIDPEWENQRTIIIMNYDQNLMSSKQQIKAYLKEIFRDKIFIVIKKISVISFDGKLSIIITFKEDKQAKFIYYNLTTFINKYKKFLGENIQIAQFSQQSINNNNDVSICIRVLPQHFTTEMIRFYLKDKSYKRMEDVFQYKTYKYCVVYTRTLEEADDIKKHLQNIFMEKKVSDVQINIVTPLIWSSKRKLQYKQYFTEKDNSFISILQKRIGHLTPPLQQTLEDGEITTESINNEDQLIYRPISLIPIQEPNIQLKPQSAYTRVYRPALLDDHRREKKNIKKKHSKYY